MKSCIHILLLLLAIMAVAPLAQAADSVCSTIKPASTKLDINLVMPEEPYYDLNRSIKELNQNRDDHKRKWLEKNNMREVWSSSDMQILGLASVGMGMTAGYELIGVPVDTFGVYWCPYFKKLDLELFYRTMIQIPKKFKKDPCRFNIINTHELEHHTTNRRAVAEFYLEFYDDAHAIIADIENQPHITRGQFEQRLAQMKQALEDAIYVYFADVLGQELNERNAKIDTPEEYKTSALKMHECPKKKWF